MELSQALRISAGQIVAFVGAGGKSASIQRLVEELTTETPVLVTTTTRLGKEQANLASRHVICRSKQDLQPIPALLHEYKSILVTGDHTADGAKWAAPGEDILEDFITSMADEGAVVLIEADGARGRSLKAPEVYEPVIHHAVNLVVALVGLDVLDTRLDGALVHRPERVGELLAVPGNHNIQTADVTTILTHQDGALKSVPPGAEVRVILNKAETKDRVEQGREIATQALKNERITALVLANVQRADAVVEVHSRIAGVILAAGGSQRFGRPKLLETWEGEPLIRRPVRAALDAGLDPVVVVLGAEEDAARQALGSLPVEVTVNLAWAEGQSTSVREGIKSLPPLVDGAMFLLADMPLVEGALVKSLVEAHRRTLAPIVAPWTGERWGNPVLFDRVMFTTLSQVRGDQGGRALFENHPVEAVPWGESSMLDIDTPEDLGGLKLT